MTTPELDLDEARAVAERFGVAIEQVRISHILAAISQTHRDDVMFIGGTALARTLLPDGRLSEDVDLIALGARSETAAALEKTLASALRRSHGRMSWAPALTDVRDTDAAVLQAEDGRLTVRVQLLDHRGYEPWPTSIQNLDQRYSDAPPAVLRVPTAAAFAAWKTVTWHDRAAPRDLWDLWALAKHEHITTEAAELFAAHGPAHNVPPPWMFTTPPSEDRWRAVGKPDEVVSHSGGGIARRRSRVGQHRRGGRAVILRCTAKARALLGGHNLLEPTAGDDEWYLNLLWFDRRKCLLLVHAGTLFPVFVADVRKADVVPIDAWLARVVRRELVTEGLAEDTLGSLAGPVEVAKTASRQMLGFMNEMAMQADYAIAESGSLAACDIDELNRWLRRDLHNLDGRYVTSLELITGHRAVRFPRS